MPITLPNNLSIIRLVMNKPNIEVVPVSFDAYHNPTHLILKVNVTFKATYQPMEFTSRDFGATYSPSAIRDNMEQIMMQIYGYISKKVNAVDSISSLQLMVNDTTDSEFGA